MVGKTLKIWIYLTILLINTDWSLKVTCTVHFEEDPPLFLTPYIESGDIEKGRQLSFVKYFIKDFESYSGFLTIHKNFDSNIFFWYFPAQMSFGRGSITRITLEKETAPVLLWLNGGPGSSSMFGLFVENGPLIVNETSVLKIRKSSWTMTNSVLYVDSPVGTGFSFTRNKAGFAKNMDDITEGLYTTLDQFFSLFPELRSRDFYITGESYAGKYIPHLAYRILKENYRLPNMSKSVINLQGISIGNGFIDPEHSLHYSEFLFDLGLLDQNTKLLAAQHEDKIRKLISLKKWEQAFEEYDNFIGYTGKMDNFVTKKTGLKFYYNILVANRPADYDYFKKFVNQLELRKALHVGDRSFNNGDNVMSILKGGIMQSAKHTLEFLLNNGIRTLMYNGQLDLIVPNRLTDDMIKTLEWFAIKEYLHAPRKIWRPNNKNREVAGYYKSHMNFTRLTLRNCGHMVPYDQPKWAFAMINAFTRGKFDKYNSLQ